VRSGRRKVGRGCGNYSGGTPSTSIIEYWGGEIDWYSPTEIGLNVYAEGSVKKITEIGLQKVQQNFYLQTKRYFLQAVQELVIWLY
jgi:hypothetical protein